MNTSGPEPTTPSETDGDGVRVVRERRPLRSAGVVFQVLAVAAVVGGIAYWVMSPPRPPASREGARAGAGAARVVEATAAATPLAETDSAPNAAPGVATVRRAPPRAAATASAPAPVNPTDLPSGDPNDIATHYSPGDPVPTMSEVIQALHDVGDHTGVGAFNPPGTSPPLRGLAVPDNFILPDGYVRHHQVTDGGEPLEPILMFSPDVSFVDAAGNPIAIPEDRVVPPEMAPPGLPIREIAIPPHD